MTTNQSFKIYCFLADHGRVYSQPSKVISALISGRKSLRYNEGVANETAIYSESKEVRLIAAKKEKTYNKAKSAVSCMISELIIKNAAQIEQDMSSYEKMRRRIDGYYRENDNDR